jgi:uncharacterized protein (DUF1800 family)
MPPPLTRRSVLSAAAVAALPACIAYADQPSADTKSLHILNRIAFGPSAADVARIGRLGIEAYIAEQLEPEKIPEPPELNARLAALETLRFDPIALFVEYGPRSGPGMPRPMPEEIKARRERARIIIQQAAAARVFRALYSPRQLEEVMVDFWFNHFNVFGGKGLCHLWVGNYEETAIRRHALGRFRDLMLATARHPAMLFYLDNWENSVPGSAMPNGRPVGLNENYARELMELHTLGVDGGYSQDDVIALARILTGWGLARRNIRPPDRSGFLFDAGRHDGSVKQFLGHTIEPGGIEEGVAAIDLLARHPATARHIAFQLAQYFVSDEPPLALVERLATRFRESDGDIRTVLAALFASREFRDSAGAKYKTPYRYVLSAVRASGIPVENPRPVLGNIARLGMPVYFCQTPDGYKNTEAAWLSPEATTLRVSLATAIAASGMPVARAPIDMSAAMPIAATAPPPTRPMPVDAAALERLIGAGFSSHTRAVIDSADGRLRAALMLGSPDFMRC